MEQLISRRLQTGSKFIVSPIYDTVFFIGAPLIALTIGSLVSVQLLPNHPTTLGLARGQLWEIIVLIVMTQSHLFIVIFRAYLNPTIFKRYPIRFTLTPILLITGCMISQWFMVILIVLNVWWDVYHSSLQTFGFGRIYDAQVGNDRHVGRGWDYGLNLVIYVGPLLSGALLMDHVRKFYFFRSVQSTFFTQVPVLVQSNLQWISITAISLSLGYIIFYCIAYGRLYRKGHTISIQKITLYTTTALASILGWGFNSFGMGFIIMNFFHAWQYFAIVAWSEQDNLATLFHYQNWPIKRIASGLLVIGGGISFALWAAHNVAPINPDRLAVSILATVATMHFWYDGFIWSVRKNQI